MARLSLASLAVLIAVLVPAEAVAASPADGLALEPLDTAAGAMPIDPPWAAEGGLDGGVRPAHLGDKILFVNFDGVDLNGGCGNSPLNDCSTIWNGSVDPFSGDDSRRAAIVQVVRQKTAEYGITVTDTRPSSGDYDMEVVGNWTGIDPASLGFAGVAPSIDCFDSRGGETSFTLDVAGTSDGVAEIILQELAHTWGLEHVDSQMDLLYPTTQGTGKTFRDECLKIVRLSSDNVSTTPVNGQCNDMHTNFCDFGWQNSHAELLQLFGVAVPDTTAPVLQILSPGDGDTIEGDLVELVIGIQDDQSPAVINTTILIESDSLPESIEQDGAFAAPNELAFPIQGLPDGDYTVTVDGHDEADNPATDQVSFTIVGNEPPATGTGDAGTGGDDSGDAGTSGDASGDPSGDDSGTDGDTDGAAATDGDDGCGCATQRTMPSPLYVWGGLVLVGLFGRRRRVD